MVLLGASPAVAAGSGEALKIAVTIDGQNIGDNTVAVEPGEPVELAVTAINNGSSSIRVRSVRLSGVALALTFFSYDIMVPFDVPAGGRATRTLELDLAALNGQAIGLLPASVELLDSQRETLGSASTVTDVRGSIWSVYGVFGLAMLVLTVLAWAGALLALARHRLSPNRWRRALRFLPAGVGTGLVAVVTLSVLRLVPPEPVVEIPVVLGAAAIALLLGYLTPHPAPESVVDAPDDDFTMGLTTRQFDATTEGYSR
ncbi:hypothetical protein [Amycolatopsis sp.]|uniref:hypothetical protein n=1 Tax=Amycolatopsis sp. TaxID=37632 RepID=UPI002E01FB48|nr:hypothetical protein [Amycolatopsis sp.]